MILSAKAKPIFIAISVVAVISVFVLLVSASANAESEPKTEITVAESEGTREITLPMEVIAAGNSAAFVRTVPIVYVELPEEETVAPTVMSAAPVEEPKQAEPAAAEPAVAEPAAAEPVQKTVEEAAPSAEPVATEPVTAEPSAVPDNLVLLDTFYATAYCQTGATATGTYTTVGRTLSVNPGVIPYGTHVWIYLDDGTLVGDYYAEDTGSNMAAHPYVVDIYMGEDSYDACIQWGSQHVSIYVEDNS